MKKRDVHVQAFAVRPDGIVDVTYMETREQSDLVGHAHTLLVEVESVSHELDEVLDAIQDLIDTVLLSVRNPPNKRPADA